MLLKNNIDDMAFDMINYNNLFFKTGNPSIENFNIF